jgi:hypothetical protein
MDGACSTCGGEERHIQGFGGETDHLGDPGIDGRIILRWIFRMWDVGYGMDRADRWRACGNEASGFIK